MTRNPGRFAGIVYLLVSLPVMFALLYVPGKIIIRANSSATAANIAAHETLFRLGIGCELAGQIAFIWLALLLYDLFKQVNRRQAQWMFWLIALPLPLVLLNELNSIAALTLVHSPGSAGFAFLGPNFLNSFTQLQRESLAMFFLYLHNRGFDIASIFWGLWLIPLGLLVYSSNFFPRIADRIPSSRILGVLLIANGCSYVIDSLTTLVAPQFNDTISPWIAPLRFGELIFMFWLILFGAKPKTAS